ncbi:MAG: triose-phosphate isomerase [Thermoanaerobaculia bacterium]
MSAPRRLFAANWKMHKTREAARAFARELGDRLEGAPCAGELVIAPSFPLLDAARDPRERWSLAGQNVASERGGAYTGEVSAAMLQDAGCRYVIIGHSERRQIFGETEDVLRRKLERAREVRLLPIYCVGETAEDRTAGRTESVLERQVASLGEDSPGEPLVVAYEPVWAIGTGIAAQPEHAAAARELLASLLSWRRQVRLLYGGSVSPDNAPALLEASGMDGFLIGGASLSVESYAAIAGIAPAA